MNLLKRTAAMLLITVVLGTAGCTKSSSDAAITSRVKTAIAREPGLKGIKVSVSTDRKVVRLSGIVKSPAERAQLIAVARKVEGVSAVKTDLLVKPQQKSGVEARGKRKTAGPEERHAAGAAPLPGYER